MKYKKGQEITHKRLNVRVKVVHVTPYHDDADQHAVVTVELKNGDLRSIPVAIQDDYLTTDPPKPLWKIFAPKPAPPLK